MYNPSVVFQYMNAAGSVPVTDPSGEVNVCACWDEDFCNSAPTIMMSSLSLLLAALTTVHLL